MTNFPEKFTVSFPDKQISVTFLQDHRFYNWKIEFKDNQGNRISTDLCSDEFLQDQVK